MVTFSFKKMSISRTNLVGLTLIFGISFSLSYLITKNKII